MVQVINLVGFIHNEYRCIKQKALWINDVANYEPL